MFFNPQQGKVRTGVIEAVERYGQPKISRDGDRLRIGVGSLSVVQALFALDGQRTDSKLLGVIAYMRENSDNIAILHLVVRSDYSALGRHADRLLAMHLIDRVRKLASQVKGVSSLTIAYQSGKTTKIPVKHLMMTVN